MQVQIRNLQYLQDSVADEKQRVKSLLSSKHVLQEKIAGHEETIKALGEQIKNSKLAAIEWSNRETALLTQIEELNGKIKEMGLVVEEGKLQLKTAQSLIDSLQEQNATGRRLLEEKSNALNTMGNSVAATVSSPSIVARAESRADKATARMKALEQEMLEIQSLNGALEANLTHKSSRADELSKEVGRLRAMNTAKVDELNEMRARDLRVEAELSAQLMEKERTAESLRDLIQRMEENKQEAEELLEERLRKLLAEQETNRQLRELLMMVNEKDSTTEELLYQLQMQEGSITTRLEDTTTILHKETIRCEQLEEELITMRKHVSNLESRLINVQSSDSASQSVAEENIALLRAQVSSSLLMCIRCLLFAAYLSIMP
jgi:chromosome segregation ATPase